MGGVPHGASAAPLAASATLTTSADRKQAHPRHRVRILLVDDHPAVRQGLQAMLAAEPGLEPAATAANSRAALELAGETRPDVALLDYHLPDEDGLWLCARLKAREPPPRVLIYTAFADDMLALLATIAGADALVSKAALADELCDALHAVARGKTMLAPISPAAMETAASELDPKDLPIVGMLVHGTPPGEIAKTLGVAEPWLAARRWAIIERLRGRPSRRSQPPREVTARAFFPNLG